jgi:hypothetical protein
VVHGVVGVAGKISDATLGALKGFGGGLVEALLKVKDLALCVMKKGKMDFVDAFKLLTRSPGKFIEKLVGDVWEVVKDIGGALFSDRAGGLATILGAATGSVVSEKDLAAAMDFVWGQFEKAGKKLGAVGCLVEFVRPLKKIFGGPTTSIVRFLLDKYRALFNKVIKPKLLPSRRRCSTRR